MDHQAFDKRLLALLAGGSTSEAATLALKSYGSEIYSLLASVHKSDEDAKDIFSLFCEQLWKGLSGFEGRASFRTWVYTIAWHASSRFRRDKQAQRELLVTDSEFARLAQRVRTTTASSMRNEKRSRLRELRETLPPEDQMILILRVERELDWRDLTRVIHDDEELDEPTLTRESARLRKRFQALKERLRQLVQNDA